MKASFSYMVALDDINAELKNMAKRGENVDPVLESIGDVIWLEVRKELQSHKTNEHHVHMADDIESKLKTSKKGMRYVSVMGGTDTAYKWRFVNDGHINSGFQKGYRSRKGKGGKTFTKGIKFIENATQKSEAKINYLIEEYVKGIVDDRIS